MLCRLHGWIAPSKQIVCKGFVAQAAKSWHVKTGALTQAGNRASKSWRYLQCWDNNSEQRCRSLCMREWAWLSCDFLPWVRAFLIKPRNMPKGLHVCISQTCTLSQNGYGICIFNATNVLRMCCWWIVERIWLIFRTRLCAYFAIVGVMHFACVLLNVKNKIIIHYVNNAFEKIVYTSRFVRVILAQGPC